MPAFKKRLEAVSSRVDPKPALVVVHCGPDETPEAAEARYVAEHGPIDRHRLVVILHTFSSPI